MKSKILSVEREFDGQLILHLSTGVDIYLPIYDSTRIGLAQDLRGAVYNDQACDCWHEGKECAQDCPVGNRNFITEDCNSELYCGEDE